MADFRHKDVDLEFRRGLEELVRGHLDGCLISPPSSACAAEDEEEEEDDVGPSASTAEETIAPRRRRVDPDGEVGLTEPSAVTRRNSRALSRWVARQAEEMITTIERRNRESELMALAGLHTVSTLDSSFLRESRRSPTSQVERPVAARAQSILQMWRELEEMTVPRRERRTAGAPVTAAGSRSRDERGDGSSVAASEGEYDGYHLSDRNIHMDAPPRAGADEDSIILNTEHPPDIGHAERETVPQIARELTTESLIQGPETRISPTIDRENENHNQNQNQRAEWLGETERERVRLVREWVQMTSRQQRDAHAGRTEERDRDTDREGSVTDHEDGQPEHVRRELLRLRGRQARLELIMRMANERQRELEFLSQHRAVSEFSHRNRIQALLRGRFLRNGGPPEDDRERTPSMAVRELGQLRHRHCVSGLREGFRFRLENIVRGQAINSSDSSASQSINISAISQSQETTVTETLDDNHEQLLSSGQVQSDDEAQSSGEVLNIEQETNTQVVPEPESEIVNVNDDMHESADEMESWQEDDMRQGREEWEPNTEVGFSDWHEVTREELDTNWQERIEHDWTNEGDEDGEDDHLPEAHEDWHEYESHRTTETLFEEDHTVETWQRQGSPENQRSTPIRRVNRFVPPEDENVYSVELRELLSRRSVSNLLHSGFRESLDQLIQSYVQRQGRTPFDWDLERPLLTPDTQNEDQDHQEHDQNQDTQDGVARPNMFPPPPLPPRQPIWRSGLHHRNWSRQNIRRSEMEWDAINDLRADMARIQEGMTNMQRALEACMDLQLELQRSVRQEVAAALNRSVGNHGLDEEPFHDGSKWSQVRKGTCCICCDNHIDSLLYRCGHMCTCSKCANELVRTGGKCPLCRAPILEVIRAYSIL